MSQPHPHQTPNINNTDDKDNGNYMYFATSMLHLIDSLSQNNKDTRYTAHQENIL